MNQTMQSYRGLRRRSLDSCYHLGNVFDAIVSSLWKPSTRDPPITSSYKKSAWSVCILIRKDAWNHASAGNCSWPLKKDIYQNGLKLECKYNVQQWNEWLLLQLLSWSKPTTTYASKSISGRSEKELGDCSRWQPSNSKSAENWQGMTQDGSVNIRGRVQMKESPMNVLSRRIIVRVRMCAHHLMNW